MKKLLLAAACLAALCLPSQAEPQPKYPQIFGFMMDFGSQHGWEPYFECNYTSHTCEQGYRHANSDHSVDWVFNSIDDGDRKTVVAHMTCHRSSWDWACVNLDTGRWSSTRTGQGSLRNPDIYAYGWLGVFVVEFDKKPTS
jgi:hypothetical protein